MRYVLTANAPETKDNDFTWKDFQARNNNELVAVYGNFVNRAMVLTQKYFEGKVPAAGELTDYDKETLKEFSDVKAEVEKLLNVFKFRDAQKEAMNLARIGNKYLADTEPWKLAKTDMERVGTILNISLQLVANLAIAFEPFLPFSSERLRQMLNMDSFDWAELGRNDLLPAGHQLNKPELLFEKIEDTKRRTRTVLRLWRLLWDAFAFWSFLFCTRIPCVFSAYPERFCSGLFLLEATR